MGNQDPAQTNSNIFFCPDYAKGLHVTCRRTRGTMHFAVVSFFSAYAFLGCRFDEKSWP